MYLYYIFTFQMFYSGLVPAIVAKRKSDFPIVLSVHSQIFNLDIYFKAQTFCNPTNKVSVRAENENWAPKIIEIFTKNFLKNVKTELQPQKCKNKYYNIIKIIKLRQ